MKVLKNRFTHRWLCLLYVLVLAACDKKSVEEPTLAEPTAAPVIEPPVETEATATIQAEFPSLCTEDEASYINAKLQTVHRNTADGSTYLLTPTDKLLSLCYQEALKTFSYRYGTKDKVDVSEISTVTTPFGTYFRRMGNLSENMVFFSSGNKIYYIVESGGMGSGVTLYVYDGDTLEQEMFSGNAANIDFELSFIDIPEALLAGQEPPHETMY